MLKLTEESARCLLCEKGKCTAACPNGFDPSRAVRAIRFENENNAGSFVDADVCAKCEGFCEKACIHYDRPIRIKEMFALLPPQPTPAEEPDLSIDFCGVHCENPFFLSSSIVAGDYDMCARAFEAGWAGAVFKTIGFLIPDEVSPRFGSIGKEGTPFIGFKNLEQISDHETTYNLDVLKRLKTNYPNKIIVASIMGQSDEEWIKLSKLVTEAGADMIECNFSCPHMSGNGLGSDVGQDPVLVKRYTKLVKSVTHLPVLAKMTPNIGNMEPPAIAAAQGGADAIAAINTIKCILGIDTETLVSSPSINGKCSVSGYSGKAVKPIALRHILAMAKNPIMKNIQYSGIGGIENWQDALEFIQLGCRNVQVCTAVMQYGYRIIDDLILGLQTYMAERGIEHVGDLVGELLPKFYLPSDLDRDTVVYPKIDHERCIGCGRCYISCQDGGHQAIAFNEETRKPLIIGTKCVGCHLCRLVCPTGSIGLSKRVKKLRR